MESSTMSQHLPNSNGGPNVLKSAGSQRAFDRLPAELLTLILAQFDSPKDLTAAVSSCQRTYVAFQGSRTQILEAVIRNAFPGTLLSEAVAACKTWPLKAAYDHGQWILLLPAQQWFLREHWLTPSINRATLKEPGLLTALYRLWRVLDRFIHLFSSAAFHNVASEINGSGLLPGWDDSLESTERNRIMRALIRFELYRQLFPPVDVPETLTNDWPYRSTHQYTPSLFLRQLPHWERGELLAISQYLYQTVVDLHLNIRQQLLDLFPLQDASRHNSSELPLSNTKKRMDKAHLWERMILFPEDVEPFKRHYSSITRLGLPFLIWLQDLPLADQIFMLGLQFGEPKTKTVESEISYITRTDMCLDKWVEHMGKQGIAGPNIGWHELFHAQVREEGLSTVMRCSSRPLIPRSKLQSMGFLFWSDARFQRILFPPLRRPDGELWDLKIYHDHEESMALLRSLKSCANQCEKHEDTWQTLQHSEFLDNLGEDFKKSYPPKSMLRSIPTLYYGIVMSEDQSAQLVHQFTYERRELVNELVGKLSDVWVELVTNGR